ncbi:MAG: cytochrome P450 [Propionibacteriales bacterium]|nr:cytochrome P450 [Propionibacteriales bacterium]
MSLLMEPASRVDKIPGPKGIPLIGAGLSLQRDLLGVLLRGLHTYGDIVGYPIGPKGPLRMTFVVVHHPDDIHPVMAQTERTVTKDTWVLRGMADLLGNGLLTSSGDEWKRQRRIVQPLFTPRHVDSYAALMAEEAARVATEPVPADHRIDLHLLMMRYTLRVVGRSLFGDAIEDLVPVLHQLVPELSDAAMRRGMQLVRVPLDRRTPRNRRPRRLREQEYALVDEVLSRSPAPGEPGYDSTRDDLVTRLREARDPQSGQALSEDEIRDQALIFLMAGHETTAGALTFTLHLLGRHPGIQDEVAAEIRAVLGDREAPDAGDLEKLPMTRAALMEGMRLYPSAHMTERLTTTPMTLAGYDVPPNTLVAVSPWTTQRHPGIWPDPERYDPSRFLGEHDRPRYAYFPFGGGPRSCVGEHFAMLEAMILLAALLRRHQVTSLSRELELVPNVTIRPAGAVPVALSPR